MKKIKKVKNVGHCWGDKRVDWEGINDAATYIGLNLLRWGRLPVLDWKEKFGTVRVYTSFGWHSVYSVWRPRHVWVPSWYPWKLEDLLTKVWPVVNKVVIPIQEKIYRYFYAKAVKKWPKLRNEILCAADWPELLEGL